MGRGVVSLAFSPFKAGLVFAGTRGQGIWRSTDSGATWARQQPSGPMTIRSFAFAKSQSLAGGDSGLFTSRDGIAWAPIPALKDLSLVALAAPAVNDPARFLAGGDASRGVEALPLYQSQDGGSTWTLLKAGLGSSSMVAAAAAGPLPAKGDVRPLVVGTNVGAYLSVDNGATWTQAAGLPAVDYNAVGFVSNHPERFYLLRLPLADCRFTEASYLTLHAFTRRDCVTTRELVAHHTEGWPPDFFRQLAVALDVPLERVQVPLGVGGPLFLAAALRVTPRQARRSLCTVHA